MKRRKFIVIAAILILNLSINYSLFAFDESQQVTGKIVAIEDNYLTIENGDKILKIIISDVTIKKGPNLMTGMIVKVTYFDKGVLIAKEIDSTEK